MSTYDLHTHSTVSDGRLTPTQLVQRAAAAGIDVLALTDHDDVSGIDEARAAAREVGIELVPGAELSVTWRRMTVHIVGLWLDPEDPALRAGLDRARTFREWRAEEMGRRLERHGVRDACAGARALAQGPILSRTHFARYLVSQGFGKDVGTVFKHFLRRNKPGHVPGEWASLEEAVGWIRGAGGCPVIAHPARYGLTATKLRRLIGEFRECGGLALEVLSGSQSPEESRVMAAHARREGMLASAGSDFHDPDHHWIALGGLPPLPEGCTAVWQAFPSALSRQAADL